MNDVMISVKETSKLLGVNEQAIRVGLQKGIFPFGKATKGRGSHYIYFINKNAVLKFMKGDM